ncbi:MAG: DnaJ domain-containing protein [Lysobacteraceae bacterium]
MTSGGTDALEQAIALYRAPGRLPLLQERPLPTAVLLLLRIVANDRVALDTATQTTGETSDTLVDAAILYIQQVLFAATSDAYRLLGVRPDAPNALIKDHYRWLMRWLHPDRQSERWEVVYSDRVNLAWQALRPDRRESYVSAPLVGADASPWVPMKSSRAVLLTPTPVAATRPLLSARMTTRLPILVLGGLALAAVAMVAVLYVTRDAIPAFDPAPEAAQTEVHAPLPQAIPSSDQVLADVRARAAVELSAAPARAMRVPAIVAAVAPPNPVPAIEQPQPPFTRSRLEALRPLAVATTEPPSRAAAVRKSPADTHPRQADYTPDYPVIDSTATENVVTPSSATKRSRAPAVTNANAESARDATRSISHSFARAYSEGDLAIMMRLFSIDAVNNRGGVQAIARDYDHLFRTTLSRQLKLDRVAWTTGRNRIIGSGPYEAIIQRNKDEPEESIEGWITIEATLEDGDWRINRIVHKDAH